MLAVDTNILVHAHQRESELHQRAQNLLVALSEGAVPWGICLHSFIEFYGVATNLKLWRLPSTPDQALDQIAAWRESPSLRVLSDDVTMLPVWADLVHAGAIRGSKVHDARIASCCLINGVETLLTVDRDFSRFPALRTRNPLVTA